MVRFAVPAKKSGTVGTVPTVPSATAVLLHTIASVLVELVVHFIITMFSQQYTTNI